MMPEKENTTQESESCDDKKNELDNVSEEVGGRDGLEPTRYGDWEKNGRCIDF